MKTSTLLLIVVVTSPVSGSNCTDDVVENISPCSCEGDVIDCSAVTTEEELSAIGLEGDWGTMVIQNSTINVLTRQSFGTLRADVFVLSKNQLASVDVGFLGSSSPVQVDLSKNQLSDLPYGYIRTLKNLKHLNVDGNVLTAIPSRAFAGLPLVVVDANENLVSNVEARAFADLPSLVHVGLYSNNISVLQDHAFFMSHLVENSNINLAANRIQEVQPLAFGGEFLQYVHLDFTYFPEFRRLPFETMIHHMTSSYSSPRIYLTDNHFDCDCDVMWVYDLVSAGSILSTFLCSGYNFFNIWDLPEEHFSNCTCV